MDGMFKLRANMAVCEVMPPTSVMNAANTRSKFPSSVVIGQIGVINILLIFILRWVVAWTAQATSLSIALLIPAIMLLTVPYFAKIFKSA